jgi:DNA-damage-inducible protein D
VTKTLVATPDPDEPNRSPFDAVRRTRPDGSEFWSARDVQPLMGYIRWHKLRTPLNRAMAAAKNQGLDVDREFSQVSQVTRSGNLGAQTREDYDLSRIAAYLLAMNGDPNKPEVAAAQAYFAVRTREAELRADKPMTELQLAHRYIAALEREQALVVTNGHLAEQVAEMAPKAEGYDDLIAADGYLDMGATAKVLGPVTGNLGRTRFINLLRGMGIILQASTLPYQHLIDRGYFAVRTEVTAAGARPYTVVTPKGLRWLHAELREDRPTLSHGDGPLGLPSGDHI